MKSHKELSKLYKENRFLFELERKKMIEDFIKNAPEEYQPKLRDLQARWDKAMKGAGKNNRLAVAQALFWEQVEKFRRTLATL